MALLMQIPQFAPLNIPAPDPPTQHTGGMLGQIMQMGMGGRKPTAPVAAAAPAGATPPVGAAPAAAASGIPGLSPEMLAQIISSLGMAL